jgi:hypothetical protein
MEKRKSVLPALRNDISLRISVSLPQHDLGVQQTQNCQLPSWQGRLPLDSLRHDSGWLFLRTVV